MEFLFETSSIIFRKSKMLNPNITLLCKNMAVAVNLGQVVLPKTDEE